MAGSKEINGITWEPFQLVETGVERYIRDNQTIRAMWKKCRDGNATFQDCKKYSKLLADKYTELFAENYGSNIDISSEAEHIKTNLKQMRKKAGYYQKVMIDTEYEKSGIRLTVQDCSASTEKIDNLISRLEENAILNGGTIEESDKFLLDKQVLEKVSYDAVVDTIKENSDFARDAGFKTVFIRHLGTDGCCKYCEDLAGTYSSDDLPDNFWMTHDNCDCWIEYKTEKVHTKITYGRNKSGAKYKNTQNM